MAIMEYICCDCTHEFPWFSADGPEPCCPRCASAKLKTIPWLLLVPDADGLTEDDYLETLLAV